MMISRAIALLGFASFAWLGTNSIDVCWAQGSKPNQWALLIGVERYEKAPQLQTRLDLPHSRADRLPSNAPSTASTQRSNKSPPFRSVGLAQG